MYNMLWKLFVTSTSTGLIFSSPAPHFFLLRPPPSTAQFPLFADETGLGFQRNLQSSAASVFALSEVRCLILKEVAERPAHFLI